MGQFYPNPEAKQDDTGQKLRDERFGIGISRPYIAMLPRISGISGLLLAKNSRLGCLEGVVVLL